MRGHKQGGHAVTTSRDRENYAEGHASGNTTQKSANENREMYRWKKSRRGEIDVKKVGVKSTTQASAIANQIRRLDNTKAKAGQPKKKLTRPEREKTLQRGEIEFARTL